MEHPDFIRQLHGVNDAEGIALERQRDFKYTGADAVQRLGDIRLPPSAAIVSAARQMD